MCPSVDGYLQILKETAFMYTVFITSALSALILEFKERMGMVQIIGFFQVVPLEKVGLSG